MIYVDDGTGDWIKSERVDRSVPVWFGLIVAGLSFELVLLALLPFAV